MKKDDKTGYPVTCEFPFLTADSDSKVGTIALGMLARNPLTVLHRTKTHISQGTRLGAKNANETVS